MSLWWVDWKLKSNHALTIMWRVVHIWKTVTVWIQGHIEERWRKFQKAESWAHALLVGTNLKSAVGVYLRGHTVTLLLLTRQAGVWLFQFARQLTCSCRCSWRRAEGRGQAGLAAAYSWGFILPRYPVSSHYGGRKNRGFSCLGLSDMILLPSSCMPFLRLTYYLFISHHLLLWP